MGSQSDRGLSVGVIGAGGVAELAHLPAYTNHPKIDDIVLAEIDSERRSQVGDEFGVARTYSDGMELLEAEDLDLVSVCTPPHTHERFFVAAADRGIHVYCEKPVSPDLEGAKRMARSAKDSNIITQVGYTRPYVKNYKRVLQLLENDVLGEIHRLKTIRIRPPANKSWYFDSNAAGGGIVADQLPHMLDFYLRLFNTEPSIVDTDLRHLNSGDVEDYAEVTLSFDDVKVTTTVKWGHRPSTPGSKTRHHDNILMAESGHLRYNMERLVGTLHGNRFELKRGSSPMVKLLSLLQLWGGTRDDFQVRRVTDFVNHVSDGNHNTIAPIGRAVKVTKIIESIYEHGGGR